MDACDENFALSINILAFEGAWCHRRCRTCSVSGSFSPVLKINSEQFDPKYAYPSEKSGFMTGKEKKLVQRG